MATETPWRDLSPTLAAARRWIETCLIQDGSLFAAESLWTPDLIADARQAFVDHPDAGKDDFLTKLVGQMSHATEGASALMAEMYWALLLFPSNVQPDTKRHAIRTIWTLSGKQFDDSHDLLKDEVLQGIGSGGPGFNNHRWRELTYFLGLSVSIKRKSLDERRAIFASYDAFIDWIGTVPPEGNRQYRHMIRYFAFPERVERMSSNGDRHRILEHFDVATWKETAKWDDPKLDTALFSLRERLQRDHPEEETFDFYDSPSGQTWRETADEEVEPEESSGTPPAPKLGKVREPTPTYGGTTARNLILYGPPGTGKTYKLQLMLEEYTDSAASVDLLTWRLKLLESYTWRPVLAAALHALGRAAKVPELRDHPLVRAKAQQRGRTSDNLQGTIWNYLQEHTPENVTTVKTATRRPPFLFSKGEDGLWRLLDDWKEADKEAAALVDALTTGPSSSPSAIQRYRMVTFHPSFTYEDFVRGIRPVYDEEKDRSEFRVVDGVFKKICDDARADPTRRYALFIDEINRANIAKVFGELITLIEIDKRAWYDAAGSLLRGLEVQLPGGDGGDAADRKFGVPANLDIYGTMNTADRSIALLDIALRRRFEFEELEPDYTVLEQPIGSIHLGRLLQRINDRLEFLIDRDHRIGHAYLMRARTFDELRRIMDAQIIPLLQEYFFDDFDKVGMVLESNASGTQFVGSTNVSHDELFSASRADGHSAERRKYFVSAPSSWTEATFVGVYASGQELKSLNAVASV